MQKAFKDIVERLEERTEFLKDCTKYGNKDVKQQEKSYSTMMLYEVADLVDDLIEIVNQVAEEYKSNDGWIPCSSGKMPMEHDSIFANYKGTKKWNDAMFEKISDEVNVTVADENGNGTTTHAHTVDGKWNCDLLRCNKTYKVIAWQPLPQPYQPKGE